ncbi:MAG: GNAT family N-acetyltransferase [Mycobacteriales bacterium]
MLSLSLADDAELRALEPWRAAEFAEHIDRARAHLAPWLPWATTITDTDLARAFLQGYADRQARDEGRIYGIWVAGRLEGGVLFRTFDAAAGNCEIGVWISPAAGGRGLVTAAARHLIDWALRVRGLARVEWYCVPHNTRSVAAAKRLGMTKEGTFREYFLFDGERLDVEVWSLLAGEWAAGEQGP